MDAELPGWAFTLKPEDAVVPRFDADVIDTNQPRAAKAHRRDQERGRGDQQLWRHFWLPRPHQAAADGDGSRTVSSDSEDNAPRRERLICRRPKSVSSILIEDDYGPQNSSLVLQHQAAEKANPTIASHSCHFCRKVAVDLRRQHAYQILPPDEQRPKGWRVQPSKSGFTYGEVLSAAADGCAFFAFIAGTLQVQDANRVHAIDGSSEVTITGTVQAAASVGFSIQRMYEGKTQHRHNPTQSLHLYTVPGTKPLHQTIGNYLPPNLLPDSQLSFTRARGWLEDCDRNHVSCRAHTVGRPYMPKRVIEIDQTSPSLRAWLSTDAPAAPYVALSYCWGGDQMAKTVKSRVTDYEKDIPLHTLPQTIQDAIVVTRGISLRYLWVDAMCIIQDDGDDMAEQIGQMYAVYRNAYVTVSAATAATSQEGFLQPRTQFRGFHLSARLDDNVFGPVLAVPEPKSLPAPRRPAAAVDYPLFTRGWTYQEHQLSPRILIYGSCEMLSWCAEATHRDGGNEHPHWQEHNQYAGLLFYQGQLGTSHSTSHHPKAWGDVIENYSQRKLTVEDDKLPAVGAVAERYAETAKVSGYLAGMWREELLLQCLWRVWNPKKTRRPGKYRAPSWSWAALDGDVEPWVDEGGEGKVRKVECELIHAETELCLVKMRFGSVKGGSMRVRARMRRVLWFNHDEYRRGRYQALNLCHGRGPEVEDEELALLMQWGGMDPRLTLNIDVVGEWPVDEEIVLWSMEVYATGVEGEVESGEGILLQQVDNGSAAGADVFRRVGRISVQSQDYMREPCWFNEREAEWKDITII